MGEIIIPPLIPVEYYAENEVSGNFLKLFPFILLSMSTEMYTNIYALYYNTELLYFQQSHGAVLAALTDYGIDVVQRAEEGGLPISEAELLSADPFYVWNPAHLAMLDALMLAHLRNVITVDRVVEAVRDDVERSLIRLKGGEDGGMIPEMEDLYDEISDGQCLCAMVHWYRPREMAIEEVCFNDQMSNSDCQYNLILLQQFCSTNLPWNPFHLEIEDILYLHDSMQMNINIFLADLFDVFEPAPIAQSELVQSPRRFIPIHSIPSLRAANSAARSPHPPRVRNPFNNVQVTQTPSRSMSMISQDSLLTNKYVYLKRLNIKALFNFNSFLVLF
uniref:Calponin-homology (CH) domain-containing protein n=1 Tax=Heterorhabditis bacteriophora TaxID=37862 RepID=A0A1I7WPW1_HETBA